MKTVYTDRYAVKVWLPALLGLAGLGFGLAAQPVAERDIVTGIIFLLWGAYNLHQRRSRERVKSGN